MARPFSTFFSNEYFSSAMLLLGIGSLISDAWFGHLGFIATFAVVLPLVGWAYIEERRKRHLYTTEIIPVPVVIRVDTNTPYESIFASLFDTIANDSRFREHEKLLEKYFGIRTDMLFFDFTGSLYDEKEIVAFFNLVRHQLNLVEKRLENKVQFHVALLRRPAFAVAMGGLFRTDGIAVYQNNDVKDRFDRVAVIDSRRYKEGVDSFEKFDVSEDFKQANPKTVLIILQIASHRVDTDSPDFADYPDRVYLRSKGNGTIGPNEDWIRYAQEIYTVINRLNGGGRRFILAHSMPEAVALILGMALENYWDITVTQYDRGRYRNVVNLNRMRYYFS